MIGWILKYKGALLFVVIGVLAAVACYGKGYQDAKTAGETALVKLQLERAQEEIEAAVAYGAAVDKTLQQYKQEVARGDALAADLKIKETDHASKISKLQRQIKQATQSSSCHLTNDTVRLLNSAAGLSDDSMPGAVCAAGITADASACAPANTGFLRAGRVSEADLLAWFFVYSGRCQNLEGRLRGWQKLHAERNSQSDK